MKRPALTSVLTWLVYASLVAVVIFSFAIQQDRINRGNERYDNLFGAYQELTSDCDRADDCYTDAPTPAEVVEGQPGNPGATGPQGVTGRNGVDGTNGEDGLAGVDGETGTAGVNGTNGADGSPGAAGADGANGRDGQPPQSWTFDFGGITFTCNRTDPFDATAPTYACN